MCWNYMTEFLMVNLSITNYYHLHQINSIQRDLDLKLKFKKGLLERETHGINFSRRLFFEQLRLLIWLLEKNHQKIFCAKQMETQKKANRKSYVCNIDDRRSSFVKHLKSKTHLGKRKRFSFNLIDKRNKNRTEKNVESFYFTRKSQRKN